jgi:hypothetical protein
VSAAIIHIATPGRGIAGDKVGGGSTDDEDV